MLFFLAILNFDLSKTFMFQKLHVNYEFFKNYTKIESSFSVMHGQQTAGIFH
jgi:hypothetical protein